MCESGAGNYRSAGPHGRDIQPHARRLTGLPAVLAGRFITEQRLRGPRPASNCFIALDEAGAAARIGRSRLPSAKAGRSLSAVIDDAGIGRGICAMDLRSMEVKTFCGRMRVIFLHWGNWGDFLGARRIRWCARDRRSRRYFSRGVDYANGEFIQVHPTAISRRR